MTNTNRMMLSKFRRSHHWILVDIAVVVAIIALDLLGALCLSSSRFGCKNRQQITENEEEEEEEEEDETQ